jgi:hypothetical protein
MTMKDAPDRPHVVKDAKGKRPDFYPTKGLDQAMSMIAVIVTEVAVLRDRLDSAERVMANNGLDLAAQIEALTLDQPALEAREAWRQNFLERLYYLMRKESSETAAAETAASYREAIEDIAVG